MFAAGLLVFFVLPVALGRPTSSNLVVRSQHTTVPSGFAHNGPAGGQILRLTIGLPQNNVSGLHDAVFDVSDPSSKNYGQHLSKSEVERLVAPKPESLQAVTDWLGKNGIAPVSRSGSGDTISIQVAVEQANDLLDAQFSSYMHEETNTTMIRTLSYSLPAHLDGHIAFISPTTHFMPPFSKSASIQVIGQTSTQKNRRSRRGQLRRADVPASCEAEITPQCLQAIYNIPSAPATATNNSLFVAGFGDEFADPRDLSGFMAVQRPDFPNGTYTLLSVDGVEAFTQGTSEATLDIQYTVGVATGVPNTFISVGDTSQGLTPEQELEMINFLLAQETVPLVLSSSFAGNEVPQAEGFTEVAQALCNAYAQLGARGTSVIISSGDSGVSGARSTVQCNAGDQFQPSFPPSCPFITAVGSTQGVSPEVAAPFSAGGFSSFFPRPDYQKDAVARYLSALGDTNTGLFNTTGRAYPDVSMQGTNFSIDLGGRGALESGTSASTPVFASVIALLNDRLLNAGKSPLGFLNPLLYSKGVAAFNDITAGSNPGCGTDGFPALAGWDPVTGLGTLDFGKMLGVVLSDDTTTGAPTSTAPGQPASTPTSAPSNGTDLRTPIVQLNAMEAVAVLAALGQFLRSLVVTA